MKAETNGKAPGLIKIGDFARLAGTNLRTLRYYEEIGLFQPASRSKGGFRFYRETDVNRLRMVHALQGLGLSLEQIRDLLSTREEALETSALFARVREALNAQDALLAQRVAEIEEERGRVQTAMAKLAECESCGVRPGPDNNYCEPCKVDGQPLPEHLSALF